MVIRFFSTGWLRLKAFNLLLLLLFLSSIPNPPRTHVPVLSTLVHLWFLTLNCNKFTACNSYERTPFRSQSHECVTRNAFPQAFFWSKDSMQGASVTLVWWHSELMFVARCSESISMQYAELSILCGWLGAQQLWVPHMWDSEGQTIPDTETHQLHVVQQKVTPVKACCVHSWHTWKRLEVWWPWLILEFSFRMQLLWEQRTKRYQECYYSSFEGTYTEKTPKSAWPLAIQA